MSITKSTLFSGAGGSVGNIVIYEVAGQMRVRAKPGQYKKSKSPKQAAQKSKFTHIAHLYHEIDVPMFYTWKAATQGTPQSGYNLFIKTNIGNMTADGSLADPSAFKICCGTLAGAAFRMTIPTPGTIRLTWKKEGEGKWDPSDLLQIAIYDKSRSGLKLNEPQIYWLENVSAPRDVLQCEFTLPKENGGEVHLFAFFKNKHQNIFSDSCYVGSATPGQG